MAPAIEPAVLLKALIACRSVTPVDDGAQARLAETLAGAGFAVERLTFGEPGTEAVDNLFASIGSGTPHLVFAGHTDVVPAGADGQWRHPPFAGDIHDGAVHGRGAVDMKGGIACFVAAAVGFIEAGGLKKGALSLMITGDEEGLAVNGTAKLVDWAKTQGHTFDAAVVGEPTSEHRVGDTIKVGRRGSLSATITVTGRQGHVAYPDRADNPIMPLISILGRLSGQPLDAGSADFEPSRLEITVVAADSPAVNVIPGMATARLNVRFNDRWSPATLEAHLRREVAEAAEGAEWTLTVLPGASSWFHTPAGPLVRLAAAAMETVTGAAPRTGTGGGTSDARFFKDVCPVIEVGLVGETMHQVDERVPLADLDALTAIYREFLKRFFEPSSP